MLTISAGQIINLSSGQGTKPAFRQCKVLEKHNIKSKLTHKLCDENIRHVFVQYKEVFVEENTFENIVCKMAAISSRPQCDIHIYIVPLRGAYRNSAPSETRPSVDNTFSQMRHIFKRSI